MPQNEVVLTGFTHYENTTGFVTLNLYVFNLDNTWKALSGQAACLGWFQ